MACALLWPLQEAYPARLMFGEALLSAVNVGQMLHAAENADDADKLRSKVGPTQTQACTVPITVPGICFTSCRASVQQGNVVQCLWGARGVLWLGALACVVVDVCCCRNVGCSINVCLSLAVETCIPYA